MSGKMGFGTARHGEAGLGTAGRGQARLVEECGSCGGRNLRTVLSLGTSPPACVMVPVGERRASEEHYPLDLLYCDDCGLAQLGAVVAPDLVFAPSYPYQSGNSRALHDNFEDLAGDADEWAGGLGPDDLVVDIGANDGTLVSKFGGCRTVGVEPTGQAWKIPAPPESVYGEFFTENVARRIRAVHGPAKVVTACNVLAHVEDIGDVMRGIDVLLADDGVLIAENHDLASVVDGGQWDTVYHEHLRFFSPYSFAELLSSRGFCVVNMKAISTHGGSFRTVAERGVMLDVASTEDYDFDGLARAAVQARRAIRVETEEPLWGIGATARATTIINYCGLDVEDIECVCEVAGSDKIGRYIPGTRIPVVDEAALFEEQPDRVLLLSWHLADVIVPKLRGRGYQGEVVVPLPVLECV